MVEVAPTIVGNMGQAWAMDSAAIVKAMDPIPDTESTTVAEWMISAPWAHPFWPNYWLYLTHLRPMPHIPAGETKIYLPGATHEFWLYAMNPEADYDLFLKTGLPGQKKAILTPMNFAAQIIEPSDEAASARIRASVVDICNGVLSPDTDWRRAWCALYGDHMIKAGHKPIYTLSEFVKSGGLQ